MSSRPNSAAMRWLKRALPLVAAGLLAAGCEHSGYAPYYSGDRDYYGDTDYYDPYYSSPASIYVGPSYRRGYYRGDRRYDRRGTRVRTGRRTRSGNRDNTGRYQPNTTQYFIGPNGNPCYINQSGNRQCIQGH